jgi:hypothetical protein
MSFFLATRSDVGELLFSFKLKLALFDEDLLDSFAVEELRFSLFDLDSYILIIFI